MEDQTPQQSTAGPAGVPAFDLGEATASPSSPAGATPAPAVQGVPATAPANVTADQAIENAPVEQFYETKLFRVLVSRQALVNGHVMVEPKAGHAHLYNFDLDEMEEFGYLMKKVSFWAMRLVGASGFTVLIHDGTPEVDLSHPLRVHVLPRRPGKDQFTDIANQAQQQALELEDGTVVQMVAELKDLMQLPQE